MSNFSAKLESDSSKKVDGESDYAVCALSSGIIEHLIIGLINPTTQAEYLKFVCNQLYSWDIWKASQSQNKTMQI